MQQPIVDKEAQIDSLLKSLHYGEVKEDIAIIEHLCVVFKVTNKKKLRNYLVKTVDFSDLFSEVLGLVEPFAQMMNEIYKFLAEQRKTARSLEHVIVGENIQDKISFDLEAFPQQYQSVIQQIEGYLQFYSLENVLNSNISPLFLTEILLACGHCNDIHYKKTAACQECGFDMRLRFEKIFQQLAQMIAVIPEEVKSQSPYPWHYKYFEDASKSFYTGTHWHDSCWGYKHWNEKLDEIEQRIDRVSKKQRGFYDLEVLKRFFDLPFWKERNRLYEVWTLVHFVKLLRKITSLRGATFEINIKDGQWHLMYGDAKEPVAYVYGKHFKIEIWYQHKLKTGLKARLDLPVEPEMLFIYHHNDSSEPLALIECKERKDYDVREAMGLATFYRAQVSADLSIFCNYFDYSLPKLFQPTIDEHPIILCGQFRPDSESAYAIDLEFVKLVNNKLGPLHNVLVDISPTMRNKDLKFVYQKLDAYLSQLHGAKNLGGVFAEQIMLCDYDELIQKLRFPPNIGNTARLKIAFDGISHKILKDNIDLSITDYHIITNLNFVIEDWNWLKHIDSNINYNITFVTRKAWISDDLKQQVERFDRVKLKLF